MYDSHWRDLVARWRERPEAWRAKVLDEVLRGRGVPPGVRGALWVEASGAGARRDRFPHAFQEYIAEGQALLQKGDEWFIQVELQIRKDVRRTFPLFLRGSMSKRSSSNTKGTGRTSKQANKAGVRRTCTAREKTDTNAAPINGQSYETRSRREGSHDDSCSNDSCSTGTEATPGPQPGWKPHELALYRVLCAISLCVKRVNYHQGINYVAALLLLSLQDPDYAISTSPTSATSDSELDVVFSGKRNPHSAPKTATKLNTLDSEAAKKALDGPSQQERAPSAASTSTPVTPPNHTQRKDIEIADTTARSEWTDTEEKAFWVLFSVLSDYHVSGVYQPKCSFLQQFLDQFNLLVRRFLPGLHRHLETGLQPGFPVSLFAMEWFTTVFSYSLRIDAVYLIWDLFLVARLDEALYVAGLAILVHISDRLMQIHSFEEMVGQFKGLVANISAKALKVAIGVVVQRIVPSALIPPGKSTLATIEREMHDISNTLNTADFDATTLVNAVQLGQAQNVQLELQKYRFPEGLVEKALLRACCLGHANVVATLLTACDPSYRRSLNHLEGISPLHVATIMGHPTVVRVLAHAGADRNLRCYSSHLGPVTTHAPEQLKGYTPLQVANALCAYKGQETSAVKLVLEGNVCLCCGRLLQRPRNENASGLGKLWDAIRPDWSQAVPRAGKEQEWVGDYCEECASVMRRRAKPPLPVLDRTSLGPWSWHCRHCRKMLLGKQHSETCHRCQHVFCQSCAFTRRRLLPRYPHPVQVCINCHHYLRSCPCFLQKLSSRRYDVYCDHFPVDYANIDAESGRYSSKAETHGCDCNQCLSRRFVVRSPMQEAEPARYDVSTPIYTNEQAMLRGYWGNKNRSSLQTTSTTEKSLLDPVLQGIEDIEAFCASHMDIAAMSAGPQTNRLPPDAVLATLSSTDISSNASSGTQIEGPSKASHQKTIKASSLDNHVRNEDSSDSTPDADASQVKLDPVQPMGHGENGLESSELFRDYRAELIEFYSTWNPSQLGKVDTILSKYKGREKGLLDDLHRMYSEY